MVKRVPLNAQLDLFQRRYPDFGGEVKKEVVHFHLHECIDCGKWWSCYDDVCAWIRLGTCERCFSKWGSSHGHTNS
jgi:hypothetical protein